jgi:hypothetical protein
MSASTAIGMVSESLRNLLVGEMRLVPAVNVTVLAPDEPGGDRRINLFLYKVQENASLKNLDWQVKRGDPTQLVPPGLALNLFYLMTSYAPNDPQLGNVAAHEILGEAMRVFYEHGIVPPEYLTDGLQDAKEQVRIMLNTLDVEELSQVWSTFTQPFRLSVLYEISVVELDMLPERELPMPRRVQRVGVPEVRSPFHPPVVERITPGSGSAASVITVHGKYLAGWQAYVSLMGRSIVDGQELTEGAFSVTVPGDVPPGFHELRVDISHLHRRVFFFEVTA